MLYHSSTDFMWILKDSGICFYLLHNGWQGAICKKIVCKSDCQTLDRQSPYLKSFNIIQALNDLSFYFCCFFFFFFSIWVFFHNHSRITGLQGKGKGISLTPHYHFHPLHRYLDISPAITAESSPLHIGSSLTRTGNLLFPSASWINKKPAGG